MFWYQVTVREEEKVLVLYHVASWLWLTVMNCLLQNTQKKGFQMFPPPGNKGYIPEVTDMVTTLTQAFQEVHRY